MLYFMTRGLIEPKDASPVTLSTQSHVSGEDACAKDQSPWSDLNAVHKRAAVWYNCGSHESIVDGP
jgi:hypothetical protein